MTVFEQIQTVAADLFGLPPEQITPQSSPERLEKWDSVQHLNLVLALEEKFSLQFSPEEIEQMHDLGQIAALVTRKLAS